MTSTLMLSLPNSGSTWLANLIAHNVPGCERYYPEFFNPLRNPRHEAALSRHFGCELIDCYRNIARGDEEGVDRAIEETWGHGPWNFTKEVWSPLKLPAFVRHFRCFVLVRSLEESFPPRRLRVWSFYEHAWHALREEGWPVKAGSGSVRARAREAHGLLMARILEDAERLNVPVIRYENLFSREDRIEAELGRVFGECPRLARAVIETRVRVPRHHARSAA